jgi:hypothetical protein
MTQISATAPRSGSEARRLRSAGLIVVGLVLGVALGLAIEFPLTTEVPEQPVSRVSQEAFVRLNTTDLAQLDLRALSPVTVDRFTFWNVDSYVGLASVDEGIRQRSKDAFIYWNTTAFANLAPSQSREEMSSGGMDGKFLEWNTTSLEYPTAEYAQQPSGPR